MSYSDKKGYRWYQWSSASLCRGLDSVACHAGPPVSSESPLPLRCHGLSQLDPLGLRFLLVHCLMNSCTRRRGLRLWLAGDLWRSDRSAGILYGTMSWVYFGHGCDGCGCGAGPCHTATDHQPVPAVCGYCDTCYGMAPFTAFETYLDAFLDLRCIRQSS
jgi:hypothetical protein